MSIIDRAETVLVLFERGCLRPELDASVVAMRAGISPDDLALAVARRTNSPLPPKRTRRLKPEGLRILPGHKWCPGCGVKPLAQFAKNRSNADGLQNYCRPCQSGQVAKSRKRVA